MFMACGLPVNFQAMVLLPRKKPQKKLREVLNQQYARLDSPGSGNAAEDPSMEDGWKMETPTVNRSIK